MRTGLAIGRVDSGTVQPSFMFKTAQIAAHRRCHIIAKERA